MNQMIMLTRSPNRSRVEESIEEGPFLQGADGVLLRKVEFLFGGQLAKGSS